MTKQQRAQIDALRLAAKRANARGDYADARDLQREALELEKLARAEAKERA